MKTALRSLLRAVQTPQIFKAELLHRAYGSENLRGAAVTDDASLVERLGVKVAVAEGSYENIKITTPEDLLLAEKICFAFGRKNLCRQGNGYAAGNKSSAV